MCKAIRRHTIFILICVAILNLKVANAKGSTFVLAEKATDDDADSLSAISAKEALPFVLFGTKQSTALVRPTRLTEAEIKDGRLASGTKFESESSDPQMFFCPHQHNAQKCLAPKQFEQSQVLECEIEPHPILEERPVKPGDKKRPCGSAGTGDQLLFVYKICNDRDVSSNFSFQNLTGMRFLGQIFGKVTNVEIEPIPIYTICYEKATKKTIFAYHQITDAAMLLEKLLIRERQIKFEMEMENYGGLVDETYHTQIIAGDKSNPHYKLQQLVPSEDMAFAWWIKPTHHFTNFALQHVGLIDAWNFINNTIRTQAKNSLHRTFGVLTGVIDVPKDEVPIPVDDIVEIQNQNYNIWITIVVHTTKYYVQEVAIMMNNFIAAKPKSKGEAGGADGAETSDKQYIDKICGKDFCANNLKQVFNIVGGEVRCCQVTSDIMNLFFPENVVDAADSLLHIPGLTT